MKWLKPHTVALFFIITVTVGSSEAEEVRYTTHIKPIFEKHCSSCHGNTSPEYKEFKKNKSKYLPLSKGPRLDSYTYMLYFIGWPDTGAIMRRLDDGQNTKDGRPGNMYHHLGETEEHRQKHLQTFKEWIGYWTLKSWSEITKEEMNRFKLKY